jgi:hypothetical protein
MSQKDDHDIEGASAERSRLTEAVSAAAAEVARIKAENAELAEELREDPTEDKREALRMAALALASAKDGLDTARAALAVFEKTGSPHGLVAEGGAVKGTIAIEARPGWSQQEREGAIEAAIDAPLHAAAEELGVVLATAPAKYTKERPGRDLEGRMVLEVAGRVEGDRLVPAVSRAAKQMKK